MTYFFLYLWVALSTITPSCTDTNNIMHNIHAVIMPWSWSLSEVFQMPQVSLPLSRERTGGWAWHDWVQAAGQGRTVERERARVRLLYRVQKKNDIKSNKGVIIWLQEQNRQICLCPCWEWLEGGGGGVWAGLWDAPQVWRCTVPVRTDLEGSWIDLWANSSHVYTTEWSHAFIYTLWGTIFDNY